jgi:uncharacterized ferredoxin-like protein
VLHLDGDNCDRTDEDVIARKEDNGGGAAAFALIGKKAVAAVAHNCQPCHVGNSVQGLLGNPSVVPHTHTSEQS